MESINILDDDKPEPEEEIEIDEENVEINNLHLD